MSVILFQGDSITDCIRQSSSPFELGMGYPAFVAGRMGLENPGKYQFYNRGVGGNRIVDLYARMKEDIINLKPDYVSILIGVNDVWHELNGKTGVAPDKFGKIYQMLLDEIKAAIPDIQIILIEPFLLRGSGTEQNYDVFRKEVTHYAEIVCDLAKANAYPCISLQAELDRLEKEAPSEYWLFDGVHPTVHFHQYIASKWIDTFQRLQYGC